MYFSYDNVNDIEYLQSQGCDTMTIIESFEKAPIDNIISALESHADKIIFLGNYKVMQKAITIYKRLLKNKGISSEIVLYDVPKDDLDSILKTLTTIIESESDCIFDIRECYLLF